MAEQAWTLGALLDWTGKHLAQKGAESPRLDAEVLLAHVVGCKRIDLYGLRHGEEASPEIRQRYRDLIRRRLEGSPVAYLVGRKEFYGLDFKVNSAVLIPRPDTETVVVEALAAAKPIASPRILDLGTGSGCIAVTLAKQLPAAHVVAVDISPEALAVARGNADKHGVADRVRFLEGDLFAPLDPADRFDIVASNPPYIPTDDIPNLPLGVRAYEPHRALDGGGDGFQILQRIADSARRFLAPGGWLIVEIGSPQHDRARAILSAIPDYELSPTVFDASRHPRVLKARRR